jgi:hypothetical protein
MSRAGPYAYRDAATLIADCWEVVNAALREREE